MTRRAQAIRSRDRLASKLTHLGEVLRGSLFERTTRHSSGCAKCARGEGHPLWVLNVGYPGGKTRQVSLRPEQVPQVQQAVNRYREVGEQLRDRTRSVKQRILENALASRDKSDSGQETNKEASGKLLEVTSRVVVGQAKRISGALGGRGQRDRRPATGRQASRRSQPFDQEYKTQTRAKETLVQESPKVADRV